jgi:hypothetical protein
MTSFIFSDSEDTVKNLSIYQEKSSSVAVFGDETLLK